MSTPALHDAAALGEILGAPADLVMEWHRRYRWPHVKIGRQVRWTDEQVESIVRRHVVTPAGSGSPALRPATGRTTRSASRAAS